MKPAPTRHPGHHKGTHSTGTARPTQTDTRTTPAPHAPPAPSGPPAPAGLPDTGNTPEQYYGQVVERITALARQGRNAPAITHVLQNEGYTMAPGRSDPISLTTVRRMLRENARPAGRRTTAEPRENLAPNEWWLRDLALELAMPSITLYGWVRRGWVTVARKENRPPHRLILHADPTEINQLRTRRPHTENQPDTTDNPPNHPH